LNFLHALKNKATALQGRPRYLLAASLGALATLALPPVHWVVALVPSLVGLIWLMDAAEDRRRVFFIGWWFGVGHFATGLYWLAYPMLVDAGRHAWLIPFAVFGLAGIKAVFTALAALISGSKRLEGPGRILVFAAAWTFMEWVGSWIFTGFPWNLIGTVWAFSEPMIQLSAFVGVYGLGLLSVLGAAMPAVLVDPATKGNAWRNTASVVVAFALLGLAWGGGWLRLASASDDVVGGVRLRLVQPNIAQKLKWKPELRREHVFRQLRMSVQENAARPQGDNAALPVTHVIWAETAVPFFLEDDPALLSLIGSVVPPNGLAIVGAPRTARSDDQTRQAWNSLYAISDQGDIAATYDKFHLVPFGEYMPLPWLLRLATIAKSQGGFSPGPGLTTLRLPGLPPVGPLICYEVIFPGAVVDKEDRPQWLLNITNDGWFGMSSGPYQHFAAARIRAVEEGLPLVRVSNPGISAVVDPYGRTIASLGLGEVGVVDSVLPRPLSAITFYGRFGNVIILALICVIAVAGMAMARRR
jgi:apolipoprotein N-acyltransferase